MRTVPGDKNVITDSEKPKRRHSYNENLEEPTKLIESEPVDAQTETAEEENVPVENIERDDPSGLPAFEDDGAERP